jgi:cell division septal protein FtsQ
MAVDEEERKIEKENERLRMASRFWVIVWFLVIVAFIGLVIWFSPKP